MKFFTPALIEMGQSHNAAILNQHEELWDEACERYASGLAGPASRTRCLLPDCDSTRRPVVTSTMP